MRVRDRQTEINRDKQIDNRTSHVVHVAFFLEIRLESESELRHYTMWEDICSADYKKAKKIEEAQNLETKVTTLSLRYSYASL